MLKFLAVSGISALLFISGCAKCEAPKAKDIVAYVNKEPVYASELETEVARKAKRDPGLKVTPDSKRDELDLIINKKLIIQEAMERGLAREERFVNTIKAFWEQALIRDLVERKNEEFGKFVFVTDDEIRNYYENMQWRMTFKIAKSRDKRAADELFTKLEKGDSSGIAWEQIGPVLYEDASSTPLKDSFTMSPGEFKRVDDDPDYYIIGVEKVEPVALEPFETLKPEIEKRIAADKQRNLFEKWLKEKRKNSKIKINI
jgi:hypothetical protein